MIADNCRVMHGRTPAVEGRKMAGADVSEQAPAPRGLACRCSGQSDQTL